MQTILRRVLQAEAFEARTFCSADISKESIYSGEHIGVWELEAFLKTMETLHLVAAGGTG